MPKKTISRRLIQAALTVAAFCLVIPPAIAQTASLPATKAAAQTTGKTKLANSQKFTTAAAAQATCPTDTVVWSSLTKTHSFHLPSSRYYGKTKHGAYVCEQAALAAGFHKARS